METINHVHGKRERGIFATLGTLVLHKEAFLDSGVLPSEPSFTFVSPLFPNCSSSIFYFIFYHEALLYSGLLPSAPSFTLPNLLKKMETTKTAQAAWFTMIMLMIVISDFLYYSDGD